MTTIAQSQTVPELPVTRRTSFIRNLGWEGGLGLALFLLMLAIGLFGPMLASYSPTKIGVAAPARPPSADNLLGTDGLGRDVMSRLLTGGLSIVLIPTIAITIAYALGVLIGFWAASHGGWRDAIVVRLCDVVMTLPSLLVVLVVIAAFGTSNLILVVVITIGFLPYITRISRGVARDIYTRDYVQMAICRGERRSRILFREVLPNSSGPLLADFGQELTAGVLTVATLSYLGVGTQPPSSNWGAMVAENQPLLSTAPMAALAPALCIGILCLALNLLADAYRRHLGGEADPRRSGL